MTVWTQCGIVTLLSFPSKRTLTTPAKKSKHMTVFKYSLCGPWIFFELLEWSMKLWAQYLHQNHWLITPAIVFRLLLLLVFFSKFTCTCMSTIQWDPKKFRRESARGKNKKIEIQTLWENSDPLGAIVHFLIFKNVIRGIHHDDYLACKVCCAVKICVILLRSWLTGFCRLIIWSHVCCWISWLISAHLRGVCRSRIKFWDFGLRYHWTRFVRKFG